VVSYGFEIFVDDERLWFEDVTDLPEWTITLTGDDRDAPVFRVDVFAPVYETRIDYTVTIQNAIRGTSEAES